MKIKALIFLMLVMCFPCINATSYSCLGDNLNLTERAICNNDPDYNLGAYDDLLAVHYKYALDNASDKELVRKSQRNWLQKRNRCADDYLCILLSYRERIKFLAEHSHLLDPNSIANLELFITAYMSDEYFGELPSCETYNDINMDGKPEAICSPDCHGGAACGSYFFVSQGDVYRLLPELDMGSYDTLSVPNVSEVPALLLEKYPDHIEGVINGWRILLNTYGYIKDCSYSEEYYIYSGSSYTKVFSQSLKPPFKDCE